MTRQEFEDITALLATILFATEFDGHVYAVGGSVRDYVMGNEIKDIDLVVDLPEGGIRLAEHLYRHDHLLYEPVTYPAYGTCQFRIKSMPDIELEAVHTRGEQYHSDSRNPETCFADINADSIRRDLTINALYFNIFTEEIIDPTGKGLDDIKNRAIRTSNTDPDIVFNDDPLRILRVIRFAARFGWNIAEKTFESMKKNAGRMSIISRERITAEYVNILKTDNPDYGMLNVYMCGLWETVTGKHPIGDPFRYVESITLNLNKAAEKKASLRSRLALVYPGVCPEMVYETLHKLCFTTETAKEVSTIANYIHHFDALCTPPMIREIQLGMSRETFKNLLDAMEISYGGSLDFGEIRKMCAECDMFDYKLPVDGNDIMAELNMPSGKHIGAILSYLKSVACEKPDVTREYLIGAARQFAGILGK